MSDTTEYVIRITSRTISKLNIIRVMFIIFFVSISYPPNNSSLFLPSFQ